MKTAAATPAEPKIPYRRAEFEGASRLARRLGLSPSHVWRVATGRRRSRRLEKALREAGVKVAAGRAAK